MGNHDVFISYSSKDSDTAFLICNEIEKRGLKCWIAPRDETAGVSYARQILQAIAECSVMVVCFSAHSNRSDHVESEIDNAFSTGKVIIPFKIDECEMSAEMRYYLNKKHWLSGIPVTKEAIDRLVESIISNIPERARLREIEHSIDNTLGMVRDLNENMNDVALAKHYSEDGTFSERLNKLKTLSESIMQMDANRQFGSCAREYLDELNNSVSETKAIYYFITNDYGQKALLITALNGAPKSPYLVYDAKGHAMLRKNEEESISLTIDDVACAKYLMDVKSLIVFEVEPKDGNLISYTAEVKTELDLDSLPAAHGLSASEVILGRENKRYDILADDNGEIIVIIDAIMGNPDAPALILGDNKIIVYKSSDHSSILLDVTDIAMQALSDKGYAYVVELHHGLSVAKFKARVLSCPNLDELLAEEDTAYFPMPIDITEVRMTGDLASAAELLAKNIHEQEAFDLMNSGWKYGDSLIEEKKETPLLQTYQSLPVEIRLRYYQQAEFALKTLIKSGYMLLPVKTYPQN